MNKITLIIVCLFASFEMSAATLKGHVFDNSNDQHLPFVKIVVEGAKNETIRYYGSTDDTGHFSIKNIPAGSYIVVVDYLGYKLLNEAIVLDKGEVKTISLSLQPVAQDLNEVSVIGSRAKGLRDLAAVSVGELTMKDLAATNSTSLAQGLNYMSGARVETNCQNCGTQQVRINGLEGQYSQILIDGMPMFTTLTKTYGLEQFPLNMIQNIELTQGGGSVLYGASAIGGVVNLITKDPDENYYSVDYGLNEIGGKSPENILNVNLSLVNSDLKSGISLFGNLHSRTPWDANGDGLSEIGRMRSSSFGLRAFVKPSDLDKFTFDYRHTGDDRRGGDAFNLPPHEASLAETTNYQINSGGVGYVRTDKERKKKLTVNLSAQDTRRSSYFGANQTPDGYGSASEIAMNGLIKYEQNFEKLFFMPAKLTAGFMEVYSNLDDAQKNDSVYMSQKQNLRSLFVQNEWKNDKLSLVVGIKADKHNLVDGISIIPRGNFRYRLTKDVNLRGGYGIGYRAPELMGADFDGAVVDGQATVTVLDPNLKPERSQTLNGGLDYRIYDTNSYAYFQVGGFYTQLHNVFVDQDNGTDANGNNEIVRRNGGGAKVYGLNMEATLQPITWVNLQMGYTIQRSLYSTEEAWSGDPNVAATKTMLRSPNNYGYFTATATPKGGFSASLSGVYTGSMLTPHFAGYIDHDELKKTPTFFDMGFKLAYALSWEGSRVEFSTGMKNIFNNIQNDYDLGPDRDSGYIYGPSLPRSYFVGFKISSL